MAYLYFNPNPDLKSVKDCTVRAICAAENIPWEMAYDELCATGRRLHNMPDSSKVFKAYLQSIGYVCHALPNTCPVCYTVSDFCKDHPYGIYILCSGEHVVAVINGDYYDNWNSADEVPLYFYTKE